MWLATGNDHHLDCQHFASDHMARPTSNNMIANNSSTYEHRNSCFKEKQNTIFNKICPSQPGHPFYMRVSWLGSDLLGSHRIFMACEPCASISVNGFKPQWLSLLTLTDITGAHLSLGKTYLFKKTHSVSKYVEIECKSPPERKQDRRKYIMNIK